jgi:hypothetical protein
MKNKILKIHKKRTKWLIPAIIIALAIFTGSLLINKKSINRNNALYKERDSITPVSAFLGTNVSITNNNGSIIIPDPFEAEMDNAIDVIGDINGDGYDDILIGNSTDDEGGTNSGQTYLFFGSENGFSKDMKFSDANASFIGENAWDLSGKAVANAGDINNDGYGDFLVSAENNTDNGKIYLFFGNTTDIWSMGMSLSKANVSFVGTTNENIKYMIGAGDVNNDTYDDILINAHDIIGNSIVYLFFGNSSENLPSEINCSNANASITSSVSAFGAVMAEAGDVNNDDYGDFLIGQKDMLGVSGVSYLFFGNASNEWSMGLSDSDANVSITGERGRDMSGNAVSGVGDVNADGYDDFIIASYNNSEGGFESIFGMLYTGAGQVYLFFGNETGNWQNSMSCGEANASIIGLSGDWFGYSTTNTGDINADGYSDFAVGAYYYNETGIFSGKTYIFYGNDTDTWSMDMNCEKAEASFIGNEANLRVGSVLKGSKDFNGDNGDDFLIGSYNKTFLLFGNSPIQFTRVPNDISYTSGATGNILEWNATDESVENTTYTVYVDSSPLSGHTDENWTSGELISVNVDGLSVATHNVSIVLTDGLGASAQDSVNVTVTSNDSPAYNELPSDISYTEGETGNTIEWNFTDEGTSNPNYTVYVNTTPYTGYINNSWSSGIPITVNVDGLAAGIYNFTIVASDGLGETISDEVIVTVNERETGGLPPLLPQAEEGGLDRNTVIIISVVGGVAVVAVITGILLHRRSQYYH